MSVSALAALAVLGALLLLRAPRRRLRLRPPPAPSRGDPDRALLDRLKPPLSLAAGLGAWLFVGGLPGLAAAVLAVAVAWRVLGRAEAPGARRRREELVRDLPVAVHLIGACLAGGAPPGPALGMVATAMGGPVGEELLVVHHRLELGADPVTVWRDVAKHPQLSPLGRVLARAHESGASVRVAVERLATELRDGALHDAQARARTVEVRSAAPLGLCFLPAFVLVGVVPLVAGIFSGIRFLG